MLVLEGVAKRYGETVALDDIDVAMARRARPHGPGRERLGQEHAGQAAVRRRPARPGHDPARRPARRPGRPAAARRHGIATVFQEVLLAPDAHGAGQHLPRPRRAVPARACPAAGGARSRRGPWRGSRARMPDLDARGGDAAAGPAAARRAGPGAGARPAHPDPRRGHGGARRRRPRRAVRGAARLRRRRAPGAVHLAPPGRGAAAVGPGDRPAQRPGGRDPGARAGHERAAAAADDPRRAAAGARRHG